MQNILLKHFASLFKINFNIFDMRMREFTDPKHLFCKDCPHKCDYKNTHLYGCYESARWDNKYIYYCPMEFIFIAISMYDEFKMQSECIIAGPIIMGDLSDYEETYNIPHMETYEVNDLAEIMSAAFSNQSSPEAQTTTTDFLNTIYRELEILPSKDNYPIVLEKKLQQAITDGDEKSAREYLNRLLGEIYFRSNADFDVIKVRALELLVVLSRSAIEGGADPDQIFNLNNNYIQEFNKFDNLEKLSFWLSNIVNRFISYIFEFGDIKHSDIMHKTVAYIKSNYMNKITLEDIAEHVFLSKSHLSKIFNKEMNTTISAFINKIRIEKSKHLLKDGSLSIADIANLTGFDDQSYFTKQFKIFTGISPKKFRDNMGIK